MLSDTRSSWKCFRRSVADEGVSPYFQAFQFWTDNNNLQLASKQCPSNAFCCQGDPLCPWHHITRPQRKSAYTCSLICIQSNQVASTRGWKMTCSKMMTTISRWHHSYWGQGTQPNALKFTSLKRLQDLQMLSLPMFGFQGFWQHWLKWNLHQWHPLFRQLRICDSCRTTEQQISRRVHYTYCTYGVKSLCSQVARMFPASCRAWTQHLWQSVQKW